MALDGKNLVFQGDQKVSQGAKLQIVNATDPEKVGPHTFTLIKERLLPQTKEEMKHCEKSKLKVCANIAKAHKVNFETGEIGRPNVDAREQGWDKAFGKRGDSWFTFEEGGEVERKVTAEAGKTLTYFCVIHPFMQGQIKVK